eukprot:6903207-Prymnesium_polylepis.2
MATALSTRVVNCRHMGATVQADSKSRVRLRCAIARAAAVIVGGLHERIDHGTVQIYRSGIGKGVATGTVPLGIWQRAYAEFSFLSMLRERATRLTVAIAIRLAPCVHRLDVGAVSILGLLVRVCSARYCRQVAACLCASGAGCRRLIPAAAHRHSDHAGSRKAGHAELIAGTGCTKGVLEATRKRSCDADVDPAGGGACSRVEGRGCCAQKALLDRCCVHLQLFTAHGESRIAGINRTGTLNQQAPYQGERAQR